MKVILVCGKSGSGKNQFAELMKAHLDKNIDGSITDRTLIRNNAQSVKDKAVNYHNWNGEKDAEGRQLLLDLTVEGYNLDRFYWEKETFTEAIMHKEFLNKNLTYVIIPDWRYKRTQEYFNKVADKLITIIINRPEREKGTHDNHETELNLDTFKVDFEVDNTKDLNHLDRLAKRISQVI